MYQENGWGIKFAQIINIHSYYEFQSEWEQKLGVTIEKVLKELNKKIVYDFENDRIKVDFTTEEINIIKNNYDEKVLEIMDHFSNLIDNYVFSRKHSFDRKDMERENVRYIHHLEELSIRTTYKNKIKLTKTLVDSTHHKINHIDKKDKLKILKLFKRKVG